MKTSHIFSLTHLRSDCHYACVTADFTPPPTLNKASNSIVPAFLADNHFFTPAFIIPREKEYYESTASVEREKFQAKILKANRLCQDSICSRQTQDDLCPPVPSTKYCQICKNSYTDYEEHLKDIAHKRQARFSKANSYISQLCRKYKQKPAKSTRASKSKPIVKKSSQKSNNQIKEPKRPKKQERRELPANIKLQNCSTYVPSLVPTPY